LPGEGGSETPQCPHAVFRRRGPKFKQQELQQTREFLSANTHVILVMYISAVVTTIYSRRKRSTEIRPRDVHSTTYIRLYLCVWDDSLLPK